MLQSWQGSASGCSKPRLPINITTESNFCSSSEIRCCSPTWEDTPTQSFNAAPVWTITWCRTLICVRPAWWLLPLSESWSLLWERRSGPAAPSAPPPISSSPQSVSEFSLQSTKMGNQVQLNWMASTAEAMQLLQWNCTFLWCCTNRAIVLIRATENPVRPCVLCSSGLCAFSGAESGPRLSSSASTWPNMVCSRPRVDWSPLRNATEEPFTSEIWETDFLFLLVPLLVWLIDLSAQWRQWNQGCYVTYANLFHQIS